MIYDEFMVNIPYITWIPWIVWKSISKENTIILHTSQSAALGLYPGQLRPLCLRRHRGGRKNPSSCAWIILDHSNQIMLPFFSFQW